MIMNQKQNILENHESRRACAPKNNIRTNIFEHGNTKLFQVHTAYAALIRRQKNEPGALALPQNPNPNASKQHAKCTIHIPAKTNARTEVSDSGALGLDLGGDAQDGRDAVERGRDDHVVEHLHGEGRHAQVGGEAGEEIEVRPCVPVAIYTSIQRPRSAASREREPRGRPEASVWWKC